MKTNKLMRLIVNAIAKHDYNPFSEDLVPGKIWMSLSYGNRIPDLIIMGTDKEMGETLSFSDIIKIFDNWANQTGPFNQMDWDTDQDAWSLSFTMDLYHMTRSPQRWLSDTVRVEFETEPKFPHWIMYPGDNTIWAMVTKLEDYHS